MLFRSVKRANEFNLGRTVAPVFAIDPWMETRDDFLFAESSLAVGAGATGNIQFTVPANEVWHVKWFGSAKPATTVSANPPQLQLRPNGTSLVAGMGYGFDAVTFPSVGAQSEAGTGRWFDQKLVLASGDLLQARFFNPDAVARTFFASVLRRVVTVST